MYIIYVIYVGLHVERERQTDREREKERDRERERGGVTVNNYTVKR